MTMWTKLIDQADWSQQPLKSLISEAYELSVLRHPPGNNPPLDSKLWENAIAVNSLKSLEEGSNILGVGAGMEITTFMLANRGFNVFPTDIYLAADQWNEPALKAFALNPELVFPNFCRDRIYPINLDARYLPFPDDYFDGVFSSGSLEHFGSIEDIKQSIKEMIRVVKPGNKISISTEFRLSGPKGIVTWDASVYLFSLPTLKQIFDEIEGVDVVGGWDLVDPEKVLRDQPSTDLLPFLLGEKDYLAGIRNIYPNLMMSHNGFKFCSIHIEIEKKSSVISSERELYRKRVAQTDAVRFTSLMATVGSNDDLMSSDPMSQNSRQLRLRKRIALDIDDAIVASEHYAKHARKLYKRFAARTINILIRILKLFVKRIFVGR